LIEQNFIHVEHRSLASDGSWSSEIVDSAGIVRLPNVGIELRTAKIYDGVALA
jgi:hypothetical protein